MSLSTPRPRIARKLLSASIGVATISYVTATTSCGGSSGTETTDGGPGPSDARQEFVVGNLAPLPTDARQEFVVGNLAPIPTDAQGDNSAADVTTEGSSDAAADTTSDDGNSSDALVVFEHIVGNLAPPPQDH